MVRSQPAVSIPSDPQAPVARRPRNLAGGVVDALTDRIRRGELAVGAKLPTEMDIMRSFGVSRTVVREALSQLQAAGWVRTRHGIGTFVVGGGEAPPFRIDRDQLATVRDVIAVLELRISLETEAAGLAAARRTPQNLAAMEAALGAFRAAISSESDAVAPDFQFHLEIARATQNPHFAELMSYLGTMIIPRTRVNSARVAATDRDEYLRRVNGEHDSILHAIAAQDADAARAAMRTHLSNSRERLRRAQESE